jgi:hypothetical protein
MLTVPFLGTSLALRTVSGSTVTDNWTLQFRYSEMCTNFDHANGGTSFTGKARLRGDAFRVGSQFFPVTTFVEQSLGNAPSLIMTLVDSTYVPANSEGSWSMTVTNVANPFSAQYTYTPLITNIDVDAQVFATLNGTGCQGGMVAIFEANDGEDLGGSKSAFQLTRGNLSVCPI